MALTGSPVIGRKYRVTAPEYIPCFPAFQAAYSAVEIPRGSILYFLSEREAGLWEVGFVTPDNVDGGTRNGMVGEWALQWLLPIYQRNI